MISIDAGAIDFWGKLTGFPPQLTSGPDAAEPRFFRLQHDDGRWALDIRSNDGLGGGGIIGDVGSGHIRATTRAFGSGAYAEILGTGQEENWHHYALVWDRDGIAGIDNGNRSVAVFLDGKLDSTRWLDGTGFNPITSGEVILAFNPNGDEGTTIAIDDLVIWDYAKTDFSDRSIEGRVPEPASAMLILMWTAGTCLLRPRRVGRVPITR